MDIDGRDNVNIQIKLPMETFKYGGVAQLGEHCTCTAAVVGSNPITSTLSRGCVLDRSEDTQRTRLRRVKQNGGKRVVEKYLHFKLLGEYYEKNNY